MADDIYRAPAEAYMRHIDPSGADFGSEDASGHSWLRVIVDAARAEERAKCEAEFGGDTLDIALTLARAGERHRIVAALRAWVEAPTGDRWCEIAIACRDIADMIERGEIGGA
jgi:hypothetical protein